MRYVKINPLSSIPQKVICLLDVEDEILSEEYIDVSDKPDVGANSWYLVGVGFVDAPIKTKTFWERLDEINKSYQKDVDKFNKAFMLAYLADGPEQDNKQATIRTQYAARRDQYNTETSVLKHEFGLE